MRNKKTQREYDNKYRKTVKGKAKRRAWQLQYYYRNPNYQKAVSAVSYAVKIGKIPNVNTLQCSYCPEKAEQYHHYKGYEPENWLDVVPACRQCHEALRCQSPA